jgi:hypothetical protein
MPMTTILTRAQWKTQRPNIYIGPSPTADPTANGIAPVCATVLKPSHPLLCAFLASIVSIGA